MMFGKLSWDAIPFHEPVAMGGVMGMVIAAIAVLGGITYFKKWGYLYREWLTSVDHKKLGIMYIVLALVMLLRGFADAAMMRTQQAIASGGSEGFLHAGPLQPDLHGARRDHDLLHGHAVHGGPDEHRGAAADRRARRRVPVRQLAELLADVRRRDAGQRVAGAGRIRAHRLAGVSAAVGAAVQPGRRASTTTSGRCRYRASARC